MGAGGRYLALHVDRTKARPRYAYLLFGAGPRVSIGASFAMIEATVIGWISCKIWYLISRTVSDDDACCGDIDDCSVRAFAVKPAPSARRHAALGLTARRGRANPATVPLMHSTAMLR